MRSNTPSTGINREKTRQRIRDIAVFAMFAALMFASKIAMEALPNIHMIGMFVMVLTVVYRVKALIPIYGYALLLGLLYGFDPVWWPIHLYVWTVLWGVTMLLPKNMPAKFAIWVYPLVCGLFGLSYGVLTAPYCLLTFPMYGGLTPKSFVAYVAAGLPFDLMHAIGNFAFGFAVYPLSKLLSKLNRKA